MRSQWFCCVNNLHHILGYFGCWLVGCSERYRARAINTMGDHCAVGITRGMVTCWHTDPTCTALGNIKRQRADCDCILLFVQRAQVSRCHFKQWCVIFWGKLGKESADGVARLGVPARLIRFIPGCLGPYSPLPAFGAGTC